MLFGNKKCPNCESEYDVALSTCPTCHTPDSDYQDRRIPTSMTWLPYWMEIVIFLIGTVGLSLIATIVSKFFTNSDTSLLWINFISYAFAIGGIIALVFRYRKGVLKSFKDWYPYVIGVVGAIALYVFSLVYSGIIENIHPITSNTNEETAESFIVLVPAASFFVIVLFGPISEELTYRLGFFSFLYRIKPWVAYLVSILLFAFIHFNWESFGNTDNLVNELLNLPYYLFAGATFALLYHKWGLSASLTAHILNNLITFILVLAVK